MMAHGALPSPSTQPRRVKVYELKNNDWYDRGTGYCTGHLMDEVPHIQVKSEEEADRLLLETRIIREDGYQKQQETLIVWTEPNGTDMALSFQEPEGCAAIWEFVNHVQGMQAASTDDLLSDDANDALMESVMLPTPELGNLGDIETMIRSASTTPEGRNSLGKFLLDDDYVAKLIPLLEVAEDMESLQDLHRLCNITKMIILLNDTMIIEHIVTDELILGIVGMLEYDPDFPTHKANHRQYLSDTSKFKEVVRIDNPEVKKKIHWIYRLQYLKDVILARILDDPTFSVLNSLIFYHQVEVLQWIQANVTFLKELFGIFLCTEHGPSKRKDAVLFIQQCCHIAKNIQPNARQSLYQTYIHHGLFCMIDWAVKSDVPSVRISGMEIIMSMIDHDPQMMRSFVFKQLNDGQKPITDTLIELLQAEKDFGVKAQVSDAIKVLLDPQVVPQMDYSGGDKRKDFYDESAKKLFAPLMDLDRRPSVRDFTIPEVSLYSHLLEILWFFVRQHVFRSKFFIITEDLPAKIVRLLQSPEKHLKLAVVKLMRILVALRDAHFEKYLTNKCLLEPILDLVIETMPRDNLLNSACLEFFEFIKRENIRSYVHHLVKNYREKLERITYVDTFASIILRWEQWNEQPQPVHPTMEDLARAHLNGSIRWQGVRDLDPSEEEYFNTSDDDDVDSAATSKDNSQETEEVSPAPGTGSNGRYQGELMPLVDYPDDDDDLDFDEGTSSGLGEGSDGTASEAQASRSPPQTPKLRHVTSSPLSRSPDRIQRIPPTLERLSEKRRRAEEEDDDELGKLSKNKKRSPALGGSGPTGGGGGGGGGGPGGVDATECKGLLVSRKRSTIGGINESPPAKKIAISLQTTKASAIISNGDEGGNGNGIAAGNGNGNGSGAGEGDCGGESEKD